MAKDPIPTPDFRHYPLRPGVAGAEVETDWLRVSWADGEKGRFHYFWLRDNAADPASIDTHSRERLFDIVDVAAAIRPTKVSVEDGILVIDWGDRISRYHPGWLRAHCYDLGADNAAKPERETWDGSLADRLPVFDADAIVDDPAQRLRWLETIRRLGIALVRGSPTDPASYRDWVGNLLLLRDMNWGKHFDVIYAGDGEYLSNKGVDIPPHNDAATRPHMPGVQIFHCVANSVEGGDSYWVDGFHIAELMRRDCPAEFELLASVPWPMANRNAETEYCNRAPFIVLDADGDLHEVRHTHWLREPLLADFDQVEALYAAYRHYVELARDPANRVEHRLQPGEVSFIDNPRVFHARKPYAATSGKRHMQIAHSEREEIDSAIRVLRRRRFAAELGLDPGANKSSGSSAATP